MDSLIFLAHPLFLHSSKFLTFDQKGLGIMTQRERDQAEAGPGGETESRDQVGEAGQAEGARIQDPETR